jgi:hypothetical protein
LKGQIHPGNFKGIGEGIQKLLSRNEIQDGCHGGHIEKAAKLVLKNNPPLSRLNTLCHFQKNR